MAKMIDIGNMLIRINPANPMKIEYSKNDGRNWYPQFNGNSTCGEFDDLTDHGNEILAQTSKGTFYSKNEGKNWYRRG